MEPHPQIDFKTSRTAFKKMGTLKLVMQVALFFFMSNRWLNKKGKNLVAHPAPVFFGINTWIKRWIFRHFCGGESVESSTATIRRLYDDSILTILDYSAEGEECDENFEKVASEIFETITAAASNPAIASAVFKVSGIARMELLEKVSSGMLLDDDEATEYARVKQRVNFLCKSAYEKKVKILVDAEQSWVQPAINSLAEEMMTRYNRDYVTVFTTIQLYRKDGLAYLNSLMKKAKDNHFFLGVKLVRGAYMEIEEERSKEWGYSSLIQESKEATDRDFDNAIRICITNLELVNVCIGTHNEKSCELLMEVMKEENILLSDSRVFVAQLLGMSDNISASLAQAGIRTAKYVPYGPLDKVIPYLLRRVNENKSVEGQSSRELRIRLAELKRRAGGTTKRKINYNGKETRKNYRRSIL